MTKLPCTSGRNHSAFGDEETAIGGPLRVVLDVGGPWNPIHCSAPCHRRQHNSALAHTEDSKLKVPSNLKLGQKKKIERDREIGMRQQTCERDGIGPSEKGKRATGVDP